MSRDTADDGDRPEDVPHPESLDSVRDAGTVLMSRRGGGGTDRRLHAFHPRAVEPEPLCQQRVNPGGGEVDRPDYLGRWMPKDVEVLPEGYYDECRLCNTHIKAGEVPQQHAPYVVDNFGKEKWDIKDRFQHTVPSVRRLAAYAWGILDHPAKRGDGFQVAHVSGIPWLVTEDDLFVKTHGPVPERDRGELERERQRLYRAAPAEHDTPPTQADGTPSAVVETDGGSTETVSGATPAEPTTIRVGSQPSGELPAQGVVTGRGFAAGVSGAGKSNSAVVIAEEVLDLGIPVVVLDPEGEFISLRDDYPVVVFDREDGDVQGGVDEARQLARRAVEERLPVVFNLGDYPDAAAEQIAGTVADAVFAAERKHEVPLLFIVDELDEYLPEKGTTAATKPLTRVAQRGRKRGLGTLGISQRPAEVSKSFVSQADYHVWHRLTWQNDIDVVERHLPVEFMKLLGDLDDGEVILDADWADRPRRFSFRLKRVEDFGATPSVADSIGSIPDEVPEDLADVSQDLDAEACTSCVFCREGIDPPAHLVEATVGTTDDVLGAYVVQETNDAAVRVSIREKFLEHEVGVAEGDTVSVGIHEGRVRLFLDDSGVVEHTVGTGPRITLSSRAASLLACEPGDHVRLVDDDGAFVLERVTGRPDALDYPILARKQPYTAKTKSAKADAVGLPKTVTDYLGLDDKIGVRHDEGRVVLCAPDDGDLTYTVKGGCPNIGAKGLKPLAAVDGDTIVARPLPADRDGPAVELEVRRAQDTAADGDGGRP